MKWCTTMISVLFQSTPSLRKVTVNLPGVSGQDDISIHTFLAEGDNISVLKRFRPIDFNPHLPCGRWPFSASPNLIKVRFQSTPSLRKVTHINRGCKALLDNFNPHLPCGRWLQFRYIFHNLILFQSTPSLRKVTLIKRYDIGLKTISIHTFLAEGDI